jgi:hypothetical protein
MGITRVARSTREHSGETALVGGDLAGKEVAMITRIARTLAIVAAVGVSACAADQDPAKDAAVKPYPLDYCIVSGDKLGEEGAPVVVVKDGQQFKLCCKDCIPALDKDPKKYEDKLAAAEKDGKHAEHAEHEPAGHDDHDHADKDHH